MKSVILIFSFTLFIFFAGPVFAQGHADHHPEREMEKQTERSSCTMMQGEKSQHQMHEGMKGSDHQHMMDGMMEHRMMSRHDETMRVMHTVQHLPFLLDRLDLTDSQVEQIEKLRNDFRKHKANLEAAIEKNRIDLDRMINEKTSVPRVRSGMKAVSDVGVELRISTYKTAQEMLDVLNSEQKELYEALSMREQCPMHNDAMHGMMSMRHGMDDMECMMMSSNHEDHH